MIHEQAQAAVADAPAEKTIGPYATIGAKLVERGYAAIPIKPGEKRPEPSLGDWTRYADRLPTEQEVDRWSNGAGYGVGVVCGKASGGLVAVDIDTTDKAIQDAIKALLPATQMVKIGSKGECRFYRSSNPPASRSWNIDKTRVLDLLSDGRQTVLPPSVHPGTGTPYRWVGGAALEDVDLEDIPELPADFAEKVTEQFGHKAEAPRPAQVADGGDDETDPFRRLNNDALRNLGAWVPALGLYRCRQARGGYEAVPTWRPSNTGQPLDKRKLNLSMVPGGIVDYGDGPKGYTAIDLVMAAKACDFDTAFKFLAERVWPQTNFTGASPPHDSATGEVFEEACANQEGMQSKQGGDKMSLTAEKVRHVLNEFVGSIAIVAVDPLPEAIGSEYHRRLVAASRLAKAIVDRFEAGDGSVTVDEIDKAMIANNPVKIIETLKAENPHVVPFPIAAFHSGNIDEIDQWYSALDAADLNKRSKLGLNMVCASDIKLKAINWMWRDRFALGKLSMIAGMPGLGKSQLTCHMAANVTRGRDWPNREGQAPRGNVIILSAEDDADDTLGPRLVAAGADMRRIHIVKAVKDHNNIERPFNVVDDVKKLCAAIEYVGDVKLVIIDPITAYLGDDKKTDSHKNASVRAALAPLQALAEKLGFAGLLISHLNKGGGQEALTRVLGSIGFVAAARASYLVVGEPETERVLFLPMKNNVGKKRPGLAFTKVVKLITGDENEKIEAPAIEWAAGEIDMTADEALAAAVSGRGKKARQSSLNEAGIFLMEVLKDGPVPSTEVFRLGQDAGISKKTLQRAKDEYGYQSKKLGAGAGAEWVWMKAELNQEPRPRSFEAPEHFEPVEDEDRCFE